MSATSRPYVVHELLPRHSIPSQMTRETIVRSPFARSLGEREEPNSNSITNSTDHSKNVTSLYTQYSSPRETKQSIYVSRSDRTDGWNHRDSKSLSSAPKTPGTNGNGNTGARFTRDTRRQYLERGLARVELAVVELDRSARSRRVSPSPLSLRAPSPSPSSVA